MLTEKRGICTRRHTLRSVADPIEPGTQQPWLQQAEKCKSCRPECRKCRTRKESGLDRSCGITLIVASCTVARLVFRKGHRRRGYSSGPMSRGHPGSYQTQPCIHGCRSGTYLRRAPKRRSPRLGLAASHIPGPVARRSVAWPCEVAPLPVEHVARVWPGQSRKSLQGMYLPKILSDTEGYLLWISKARSWIIRDSGLQALESR